MIELLFAHGNKLFRTNYKTHQKKGFLVDSEKQYTLSFFLLKKGRMISSGYEHFVGKAANSLPNPVAARSKASSPVRTLGPWVRIPLKAWMSVCVVLCVGSGLATG
jgi:hypothetical protein